MVAAHGAGRDVYLTPALGDGDRSLRADVTERYVPSGRRRKMEGREEGEKGGRLLVEEGEGPCGASRKWRVCVRASNALSRGAVFDRNLTLGGTSSFTV